ncbi:MAG: BolA family protein [Enterobacterales bacterium]|nr:BolA family protein [Enterobacterales bacterium]
MNRLQTIENCLQQKLDPSQLEVIDESHLHAGHAGARSGKGHFKVIIKSDALTKLRPLARHQAIYAALGELMQTEIHALSIKIVN